MSTDDLFQPLRMGALDLPNRILMAPLTRSRAKQPGDTPWALNAEYYAQRASAGLIIGEATQVSPMGRGYAFTPGIYSPEQVAGWKLVTDAVHAAGGRMFLQLWHVGRISHVDLLPDGAQPIAPSAIAANTQTWISADSGMVPVSAPRAIETDEIAGLVAEFRAGAENAKAAGFDGVEIHGANGYLLDQFTRDATNKRDDAYGGTLENRLRFPLEVAKAVTEVWGADRVGYRISPVGTFNDISDSNPVETFGALAAGLSDLGLAYVHVAEAFAGQGRDEASCAAVRSSFKGVYVANGGLTPDAGAARIAEARADAVAFGTLFIGNPDLVKRIRVGADLSDADQATFYGGDAHGYTDYATLEAAAS